MKLKFPKFCGDNFKSQLIRVEYYFELNGLPKESQVKIVALHLEGKAIQWHQELTKIKIDQQNIWEEYIQFMRFRFGAHAYDDLRNLKQVRTLQEYLDMSDELYPRVGIKEDQTQSFFLFGLIDVLQMPVRMFMSKQG